MYGLHVQVHISDEQVFKLPRTVVIRHVALTKACGNLAAFQVYVESNLFNSYQSNNGDVSNIAQCKVSGHAQGRQDHIVTFPPKARKVLVMIRGGREYG